MSEKKVGSKPFELLLDQASIAKRVSELGKEITADYRGKHPVLLGVLKGCIIFLADLMRAINLSAELELVSASSYRKGKKQETDVLLASAVSIPLKDRHILIVEGVVDSGRTVSALSKELKKMEPASIEVVTLIDKPASHRRKLQIRYKGFTLRNDFVIGYGLDNTQKYRNLPFIGRMVDE